MIKDGERGQRDASLAMGKVVQESWAMGEKAVERKWAE